MSIKAWNPEEEKELITKYESEKDVTVLADYFHKSYRSVISKLVQLKIYERPENPNKFNKTRTVKEMLRDLEKILGIQLDGTNLNKKENLTMLIESIESKKYLG